MPSTGRPATSRPGGRAARDTAVELTEAEYREALARRGAYWLYIVYAIATGSPRLLAIQDPVASTTLSEIHLKRYRLQPR